jgi:hypothetical protein
MLQGQHCLHFTLSKVQGCEKTTFEIVGQEHAWQCRKKLGRQLTFSNNGWFFLAYLFGGVFQDNQRLFVLDGHGSHVIIQTSEQSNKSWVRHGHLTYSYFLCITDIKCHLL